MDFIIKKKQIKTKLISSLIKSFASITLKGNLIHTIGNLPEKNSKAPDFSLTSKTLEDKSLSDFKDKKVVLNIFPSLDTEVCAASVRKFNKEAGNLKDTVVLCVSRDLPFAQNRFCVAEGLNNVITLSEMKDSNFSEKYGVKITDGPLKGLMSRSVVILDKNHNIIYTQQVPEITQEPNYKNALDALK
ncbi:thiol peroxidase [Anaeramoeba ignava]|uniref:Thiol peroxidase n=1 Tax=Anaeramoeba ignava TaxID=1746090 RepID=A0A9Q0LUF9_ANAIG|nr:thiol peroxidase [Anaeramoeba ignava]